MNYGQLFLVKYVAKLGSKNMPNSEVNWRQTRKLDYIWIWTK